MTKRLSASAVESIDKQNKKKDLREIFSRDEIRPKLIPIGIKTIKILSWNVPGLRSAVKLHSNKFVELVKTNVPDIICLQETKLQNEKVEEFELFFETLGYTGFWSCSTLRKGYSGTAVLVRNDSNINKLKSKVDFGKSNQSILTPTSWSDKLSKKNDAVSIEHMDELSSNQTSLVNVEFGLPDKKFNGEGRVITLEFNSFYLVSCYVPNSGQDLGRLNFRVNEWDPYMRQYLHSLKKSKPVIFGGDLNCGNLDLDIYNFRAKHIQKIAGLTPQERESFKILLNEGFIDAFRFFHPVAKGQFTYWSQRTSARAVNCGIRIDYFICSSNLFGEITNSEEVESSKEPNVINIPHPGVFDCYHLSEETDGCSDHCPIVLVLQV